jgi:hypothetical protein
MKTLLTILLLFFCLHGRGQGIFLIDSISDNESCFDTLKTKSIEIINMGYGDTIYVALLITEHYFDSTITELKRQIKELRMNLHELINQPHGIWLIDPDETPWRYDYLEKDTTLNSIP